jgi:hypothetical protein
MENRDWLGSKENCSCPKEKAAHQEFAERRKEGIGAFAQLAVIDLKAAAFKP